MWIQPGVIYGWERCAGDCVIRVGEMSVSANAPLAVVVAMFCVIIDTDLGVNFNVGHGYGGGCIFLGPCRLFAFRKYLAPDNTQRLPVSAAMTAFHVCLHCYPCHC